MPAAASLFRGWPWAPKGPLLAVFTDMAAKAVVGAAILLAATPQRACCMPRPRRSPVSRKSPKAIGMWRGAAPISWLPAPSSAASELSLGASAIPWSLGNGRISRTLRLRGPPQGTAARSWSLASALGEMRSLPRAKRRPRNRDNAPRNRPGFQLIHKFAAAVPLSGLRAVAWLCNRISELGSYPRGRSLALQCTIRILSYSLIPRERPLPSPVPAGLGNDRIDWTRRERHCGQEVAMQRTAASRLEKKGPDQDDLFGAFATVHEVIEAKGCSEAARLAEAARAIFPDMPPSPMRALGGTMGRRIAQAASASIIRELERAPARCFGSVTSPGSPTHDFVRFAQQPFIASIDVIVHASSAWPVRL
jgi:hypothetical protein